MKLFNLFLITAPLLLSGCQKDSEGREELPDAQPIELRAAEKVATDNDFSLDLFKHALSDATNPNVFVSPLSVSMALNMTLNGAAGATAAEMLTALRAENYSTARINDYSQSLRQALIKVDPSTKLAIANSIWYRQGFPVKASFIDVNKEYYDAEVKALDFSSSSAVKEINGWCAKQTNDLITQIVDQISPETAMYLINAVYFKGIWAHEFDKSMTRDATFTTEAGDRRTVKMMMQKETFAYAANDYAAFLSLPYGNKAFEMIVMLPHSETANELAERLDSESWAAITEQMAPATVRVQLPRFKAECEYDLRKNILPMMGMTIPFDAQRADFSLISDVSLYISAVIHKTFVEVNEEGTEAAAVTAVEMAPTSIGPTDEIAFVADKPFLFAIRERSTGVILFIGKMGAIAN
ncbi:MAG: serpin family protein [Tannerellaceae bacterium]|jgi:serpin B|nr:serpin family protein [Tannerellaceae bacterium]